VEAAVDMKAGRDLQVVGVGKLEVVTKLVTGDKG
jgi:hypothetical protein